MGFVNGICAAFFYRVLRLVSVVFIRLKKSISQSVLVVVVSWYDFRLPTRRSLVQTLVMAFNYVFCVFRCAFGDFPQ